MAEGRGEASDWLSNFSMNYYNTKHVNGGSSICDLILNYYRLKTIYSP